MNGSQENEAVQAMKYCLLLLMHSCISLDSATVLYFCSSYHYCILVYLYVIFGNCLFFVVAVLTILMVLMLKNSYSIRRKYLRSCVCYNQQQFDFILESTVRSSNGEVTAECLWLFVLCGIVRLTTTNGCDEQGRRQKLLTLYILYFYCYSYFFCINRAF